MDPLDPDEVLGFSIVRTYHLVARRFYEVLATLELTPSQFGALTALARTPHVTQADLARTVLMTPQSAGEMLRGLVRRGLVHRQDGVGRGHGIRLQLTDAGRDLLARATPPIAEMNRAGALGLTEGEAARLAALLGKVTRAMSGSEP